jgi:hypothetical protein
MTKISLRIVCIAKTNGLYKVPKNAFGDCTVMWNTVPFQSCRYVCRRLDDEDKENMMPDSLALQEFHSKKTSIGKSRRLTFLYLFSATAGLIVHSLAPCTELGPSDILVLSSFFLLYFSKRLFLTPVCSLSSSAIIVWMRTCLAFVRGSVRIEAWNKQRS